MSKTPRAPYGRVFYFGKRKDEIRKRELSEMALGGIEPEWDGLLDAEEEFARPAREVPSR